MVAVDSEAAVAVVAGDNEAAVAVVVVNNEGSRKVGGSHCAAPGACSLAQKGVE